MLSTVFRQCQPDYLEHRLDVKVDKIGRQEEVALQEIVTLLEEAAQPQSNMRETEANAFTSQQIDKG